MSARRQVPWAPIAMWLVAMSAASGCTRVSPPEAGTPEQQAAGDQAQPAAPSQPETGIQEQAAHREHGYITMKDGVRLAYSVWRPRRDGQYPTLFQYSGYADNALTFEQAKPYLDAGYAMLGANVRGSGCSEGYYEPFLPIEGVDGAQIVEWAAAQPWSTGNIGMIGNSYSGSIQYAVAAERPPHLKALSAGGSNSSRYRDWLMVGGIFHQGNIGQWGLVRQRENAGNSARTGAQRRIKEWGDQECAAILARQKPHDWYWQVRKHPLQDSFWERTGLSHEHAARQVTIPTQMLHGWQDNATAPNAPTRLFAHYLTNVAHKHLVLTNGGHSAVGLRPLHRERIRWMDRWLKGEANGVETEPAVKIFWETRGTGRDAVPGWTTTYANWPPANLQRTTFHLTADARLSRELPAPSSVHGVRNYLYPSGTELIGSNEQFALAPFPSGSLHYRTDPALIDMTILGNPEVVIHFSAEQKDVDFLVTLKDVDPAGNTLYLTRGFLRASLRAVDRARSTPDEVIQSFSTIEELIPGRAYEARFSLWTVGHVVRAGHRLELSILAPSNIPSSGLGAAPVGGPSVNKVFHSSQYPSALILPLVPGETARAAVPDCGSLAFQPCRKADAAVATAGGAGAANAWHGGFRDDR